jgi:hypothetical protein
MIALILVGAVLVGAMCVLAFTLATYALPFMLGLAAARLAFPTGAGIVGAGLVGLVVGVTAFAMLASVFSRLRSPVLRGIVMVVFVTPAAVAGYSLVHGLVRPVMPSELWRQVFCLIGGAFVGVSAWVRLASSHNRL